MKLKWGIIGCGGIADRRTLPGMMSARNSEPYAVMDANFAVAERVKEIRSSENDRNILITFLEMMFIILYI